MAASISSLYATILVQQRLSVSVPLIMWRGDAKGSAAESEFCTLLDCLGFRVDSNWTMTSRRPITRSSSGNGRTGSFNEEEGSSSNGRTESRNPYLSNVRPENRSTLCSVMAQLTEDIQPSFETTLKSKAVSEKCNVKLTCVVSGYPAPELKWYKDDMELDRYCGLPKYEIHRNGKNHTLQIYNCTLDDAAIYQVSATNSKGIVSCSGVLEVGTMNEFQIHQRFFAKLKQKADNKKRDLEEQQKRDKENTERPQRKRPGAEEQLGAAAEPNGVTSEVKDLEEISEAKKKIKITNGIDAGLDNSSSHINKSNVMGNGGENGYDGGMGLAQFMAEALQSQAAEEKQSPPRGEDTKEMDMPFVGVSKEKEREQERMQKVREEQEKALGEEYERKKRREEQEQALREERERNKRREEQEKALREEYEKKKRREEQEQALREESERNKRKEEQEKALREESERNKRKEEQEKALREEYEKKKRREEQVKALREERERKKKGEEKEKALREERERKKRGEEKEKALREEIERNKRKEEEEKALREECERKKRREEEEEKALREERERKKRKEEEEEKALGEERERKKRREEEEKALGEERERKKGREEELADERERTSLLKTSQRLPDTRQRSEVKHHSKAQKDHDHQQVQASISTVLHTVKDFFFGKSKKDSPDHTENTEREFDHSRSSTPPPPPPPPSRLQPEQNPAGTPLAEDTVAVEVDKPKEPSESAATEQRYPKPRKHKNENSVRHADQQPTRKLPAESVEGSTGQRVDAPAAAAEAMEVSAGQEGSGPGEEVLTEAEEKDPQKVSVFKEVPVRQQEPDCLLASPQPNHQAAREKSSPREEISVLPLTRDSQKEERSSTSALTSLKESWTSPHNLISASKSCSLGDTPVGTSPEEKTSDMGKGGQPDAEEGSSSNKLCEQEKAEFMSKAAPDSEVITAGDRQMDRADEDLSGGSTPTSSLSCENSPRLKRRDSLSLIRSATPEELASGARRKIFMHKTKEDGEGAIIGALEAQSKKDTPYMSPSQARRAALLQAPTGQNTPPMERRSPLLSRRKATLEVPKAVEETPAEEPVGTKQDEKPAEKKLNPLKAPQVIRKIRGEPFPDASGHLKLWCQFFNVLSDSTIKWYRDEEEILEVKRSGGDESQVALAVVLASIHDCGVYGCTIINEYGSDTTDFLLSVDIGEEIEMTPLLFNRGLADCGSWAEKYFGRIMTETVRIGKGCNHKASRVKVIYGLDPIFESGSACIIKVQSPIAYGITQENKLIERNLQLTKQECKVQNMIREYCKIFAAEARVIENFGFSLEVIAQYLMYRPANSVPYATVEAYFEGDFLTYCMMDAKGKLVAQTVSEVEQKCNTFQHWIYQWTHGNLLVTRLEGVETKITNVRVVTKSKGYQGLTEHGSPEVFEQFSTHHQCNYYCGLLGLCSLKTTDSLQQPAKMKGSRSPLLNRKLGSNSPKLQRKGQSPQTSRKASSPKVTRKNAEAEDNKTGTDPKPAETVDVLETR
ncbi:Alpha-protein kinase 3 [Liparis tanakae]|uniref:non-specific serine/threonine protein kinase n=1 Tax=Liparis tanakae TaxID=230148 RepID=A0A4Z2GU06_9TELE|nr:Alpha-protein kinase 3 [Liparis tanakae]